MGTLQVHWLNTPSDYEMTTNFRYPWCAFNTRFANKSSDPAQLTLHKLHTSTSSQAAFGSREVLRKAAATKGIKRQQNDQFLSQSETYTKFRAGISKFTRLKVQS